MKKRNFNKTLIIGLDGASPDLIRPWVEEGKLPNLATFFTEGIYGSLKSVPNMNSAPAWCSMVTGKNPGKHGIFWFNESQTEDYQHEYINASFRDGKTIWQLLSDAGKRVLVVNVPITFPAEKVNGNIITGIDAPSVNERRFTCPEDLYREIVTNVGGYRIVDEMTSFLKKGRYEDAIKSLHDTIDLRYRASKYLMQEKEWDFSMIVFTETDRTQHMFWKYMRPEGFQVSLVDREKYKDVIFDIYRHMDEILGMLVKLAGDNTNIFVVSDHGACGDNRRSRLIPLILEEMGLLRYKGGRTSPLKDLLVKTVLMLDRTLSRDLKKTIANSFPGLRKRVEKNLLYRNIDWCSTRAFSDGNRWEIWVNLKGRQQFGIVNPGKEYDDICRDIIEILKGCNDMESGRPLFKNIFTRDEVYHGRYVDKSPDIIVEWEDIIPSAISCNGRGISIENGKKGIKDPLDILRSGGHSRFGIVLIKGPDIKKGIGIQGADILDIAPTILYAMGEPVASDMDGKVLVDSFKEEFLKENQIKESHKEDDKETLKPKKRYSDKDSKKIAERLRGLGYID